MTNRNDFFQEVLDDVIIRVMAREYLDSVKAILTTANFGVDTTESDGQNSNGNSLSELGLRTLREPALCQAFILTSFEGIQWPDGPSSCKAAALAELIVPK